MTDHAALISNEGQLLLNIAIGVGLPNLVALIAHRLAPSPVKTVILLALAAAGSVLASITVASFHWKDVLAAFSTQLATAVISHYGVLRPLGVTGSQGVIARSVPGGVSAPSTTPAAPDPQTGAIDAVWVLVIVTILILLAVIGVLHG